MAEAFRKLCYAARLAIPDTHCFNAVAEWDAKRTTLLVQLEDIPQLVHAHIHKRQEPYANDSRITLVDNIPTVRLASACEAAANGLYSVAEIAANFANKVSKGALPSSFNALRKRCEQGLLSEVAAVLGDLQWYRKVRELRTEWTHFSSVFIGQGDGQVLLCVRAYRRASDQQEFTAPSFTCAVDTLLEWLRGALATLDRFAGYLLSKWILPTFPMDQKISSIVYDSNGYPTFTPDFSMEVKSITVREYLRRGGITAD